jgi:shikimate dehydrogenase
MKYFAVIGNPIDHSLSPRIHKLFAEQVGIKLDYRKQKVQSGVLSDEITRFFTNGGSGLNVTVPHKQAAYALCDDLSPRAKLAGSVNTLYMNEGQLIGENTDGVGLVKDITDNLEISCQQAKMLIIGAGGASRGIIEPLLAESPHSIDIVNRTFSKAVKLAKIFKKLGNIRALSFDELLSDYDIIINASSSSLQQDIPAVPEKCLASGQLAYDLMYADSATAFMSFAAQAGCKQQTDGLGMLVEQAAEAFAIWNGYQPETKTVIACLRQ